MCAAFKLLDCQPNIGEGEAKQLSALALVEPQRISNPLNERRREAPALRTVFE
jgi:hypothetical protein